MELQKRTSLETNESVTDALNWKLAQIQEKNLPVESGLADYIAFGTQNIDMDIEQLSNYKSQLDAEIKKKKAHKVKVLEDVAMWLEGQGLDRLDGVMCSSITITKAKEAKEEEISKIVFETVLTQHEIEEMIVTVGKGQHSMMNKTKITPATTAKIKVNSKRK